MEVSWTTWDRNLEKVNVSFNVINKEWDKYLTRPHRYHIILPGEIKIVWGLILARCDALMLWQQCGQLDAVKMHFNAWGFSSFASLHLSPDIWWIPFQSAGQGKGNPWITDDGTTTQPFSEYLCSKCLLTWCTLNVQVLCKMCSKCSNKRTRCALCAIKINCNQGSLQILIVHLVLQVIAKTLLHNNYNFNQIWPFISTDWKSIALNWQNLNAELSRTIADPYKVINMPDKYAVFHIFATKVSYLPILIRFQREPVARSCTYSHPFDMIIL